MYNVAPFVNSSVPLTAPHFRVDMQVERFGVPEDSFLLLTSKQIEDMICWASALQMTFREHGIETMQEEHVCRLFGGLINYGATAVQMQWSVPGLARDALGRKVWVGAEAAGIDPVRIIADVIRRNPVLLICQMDAQGLIGHALVLFLLKVTYLVIGGTFGWFKLPIALNAVLADPSPFAPMFREVPWAQLMRSMRSALHIQVQ